MSSADVSRLGLVTSASQARFYNFTAWTGFLCSIPLLLLHTLGVPRQDQLTKNHAVQITIDISRPDLRHHPWHAAETIFSSVWAFFFFIASCVVLGKSKNFWVVNVGDHGAFVSAGFFGLLATGLYSLQVFLTSNSNIRLTLMNMICLDLLLMAYVAWKGARPSGLGPGGAPHPL